MSPSFPAPCAAQETTRREPDAASTARTRSRDSSEPSSSSKAPPRSASRSSAIAGPKSRGRAPAATSARTTCEPTNPRPPTTRTGLPARPPLERDVVADAGLEVARRDLAQRRPATLGTGGKRERTAGAEDAARGRVARARDLAGREKALARAFRAGRGLHQDRGVGVARTAEE